MSVNGVEIKVGQKWKTRGGRTVSIAERLDDWEYPWRVETSSTGSSWTVTEGGTEVIGRENKSDLMFLVEDPDLTLTQPAALMVEEIKTTPHPLRRAADWPEVAAAVDDTAGLPAEPQFENSLPGALLGPDEALNDIRVTESDPRAQQTADSPKRRAADGEPIPLAQERTTKFMPDVAASVTAQGVAAIERLQANQDEQGRTPFMQALADMKPGRIEFRDLGIEDIVFGNLLRTRQTIAIEPTPEQTKTLRDLMDEGFKQLSELGPTEVRESSIPVGVETHTPQSALDRQIGGGHYKTFAIQPVEFIHKNGIGFIEGNCIKYLARWREKGGIQDLEKVKHYIDLLIELERGES